MTNFDTRKKIYGRISKALEEFSDGKLLELTKLNLVDKTKTSWGETGMIDFYDHKIFYKKIPVASIYKLNRTTNNLYKIPAFYNYGFGSAGLNPWRELLTHVKTTNFVLTEQCYNFPILYHHRLVHDTEKNYDFGLDEKLMNRFSNDTNIKNYLEDRSMSDTKIIMFLEYVPHILYKYIISHQSDILNIEKQILNTLDFLDKNKVLHMDAHFGNYLVDNFGTIYLTDFGLVLDKQFELLPDEETFMKSHKNVPYIYLYESMYSSFYYQSLECGDLKDLLLEQKKKDGKYEFSKRFIDNIRTINEIVDMDKIIVSIIEVNKSKILQMIKLKLDFYDKS